MARRSLKHGVLQLWARLDIIQAVRAITAMGAEAKTMMAVTVSRDRCSEA